MTTFTAVEAAELTLKSAEYLIESQELVNNHIIEAAKKGQTSCQYLVPGRPQMWDSRNEIASQLAVIYQSAGYITMCDPLSSTVFLNW